MLLIDQRAIRNRMMPFQGWWMNSDALHATDGKGSVQCYIFFFKTLTLVSRRYYRYSTRRIVSFFRFLLELSAISISFELCVA